MPQEGALFPHLSVADNIAFGLPRAARRRHHRVDELLEMVGLPASYASRAPQQLSGGQQQRVALARALAPEPSLVILDEPFSALDTSLRHETRGAVADALAAAGATSVLVTHDQPEAMTLGDEVAVMWHGRLVQTAAPQTLYRQPVTQADAARGHMARVEAAQFAGQDANVVVRLDADPDVLVRARVPGHRCPAVGERVALVVDGAVMAYAR